MMKRLATLLGILFLLLPNSSGAVSFQWVTAPDPPNAPLQVAVWLPSDDPPNQTRVGSADRQVARDGQMSGANHPLVVISHGVGGSALDHRDTAMALARAGFVVAAVTHAGDNSQDRSDSFTAANLAARPRQISRVIDTMTKSWPDHPPVDPARIGIFGNSAGGATALLTAGGRIDLHRMIAYCRDHPQEFSCEQRQRRGLLDPDTAAPIVSGQDSRIKVAVLTAPALAFAFRPESLTNIKVSIQLWLGSEDTIVHGIEDIRDNLPMPPDYHLAPGAGHEAFLAPCSGTVAGRILAVFGRGPCQDPPGFDRAAFLRMFQQEMVAFFRDRLG